MSATYNFTVRGGDTFTHTPILRDKTTQVPINLTGASVAGTVGGVALTCSITNATAGTFTFGLSPTQTAALKTGTNPYEVILTYADGTVQTLLTGNVVIT